MFDLLKVRINHGDQAIPDIRKAKINDSFRGLPSIQKKSCPSDCSECLNICLSDAIKKKADNIEIDLGKCILCGDCARVCHLNKINFSTFYKMASTDRNKLFVSSDTTPENYYKNAVSINKRIKRVFGKSLKLRSVSAAGCNACELELNACSNVNFDMTRFGIEIVASPRHADGIIITGPINKNMSKALADTYKSVPSPKIVIAAGACAISSGIFKDSPELDRTFLDKVKIDLYVPGCPAHPLSIINGILDYIS